jgi:hypothetical protein
MAERRKLEEIYTVEDKRDGSWATWLAQMGKVGTYVLSLLCQRENSERESYKEVARVTFLSDDSAELVIFHELMRGCKVDAARFLPHVLMAYGVKVRGYEVGAGILPDDFELLPATRCKRCGRLLTRPESIRTRLGDECAGRKPRAGSKYATAKLLSVEDMRAKLKEIERERNRNAPVKLPR